MDYRQLGFWCEAWEVVVRAVHGTAVGDCFGEGSPVFEAFLDVTLINAPVVLVDKLLNGGEVLLELD